jgi:hypothetical protein
MAVVALACTGAEPTPPPPPPGTLIVGVNVTGPLTPGPGYVHVYVDGLGPAAVWADSFRIWPNLPTDTTLVRLDVLRPHCSAPAESLTVAIPSADTASVQFAVTCWDAYGLVRIDLPTTGSNLPSDLGIEVVGVIGTRAAPNTAGLGFPLVPIGPQTVQIFDVPGNCAVTDSNPQHVIVPTDSVVLRFGMVCS